MMNRENEELLVILQYALEWMGRKPKGQYERQSLMLAQGAVRIAIVRAEKESKVESR